MMFKNRVLGKIPGLSGEEMIERYRKLHFIRAKTLAGHVEEKCIQIFGGKTWREGLGVDARIIFKVHLKKRHGTVWTRFFSLGTGTSGRLL